MKRVSLILLPCLLVVVLGGLFLRPTFAHGALPSTTSCGKGWSVVSSPNRGNYANNDLSSVAAISATDVWAVGASYQFPPQASKGLTEHWNGTAWSVIPDVNPGGAGAVAELTGVAAVATNDVWAVGYIEITANEMSYPIIEHWNGAAWSLATIPSLGGSQLYAVVAISSTDVWAVGSLTMHWNGTAWSVVPNPSAPGILLGVTAVSATNVWAVGGTGGSFIEHWDGTSWKIVASPTIGEMNGVAAASATDIWAVGWEGSRKYSTVIRIEHWDGTKWTLYPLPNMPGDLSAVDVVSENNVWAVGNTPGSSSVIAHWNGTKWNIVSGPNPGQLATGYTGVTHIPGTTQVWVVGYAEDDNANAATLTAFHC
ncbi:MAG: beta propeller repeat protein [Ktedonobacteraceae bacterium]